MVTLNEPKLVPTVTTGTSDGTVQYKRFLLTLLQTVGGTKMSMWYKRGTGTDPEPLTELVVSRRLHYDTLETRVWHFPVRIYEQ